MNDDLTSSKDVLTSSKPLMFHSVILLEPQRSIRELMADCLGSHFQLKHICQAANLQEAMRCLAESPRSLILAEIRFPEGGISQLADVVRRIYPQSRLVVWTQHSTEFVAMQAEELGLAGILAKSIPMSDLVREIQRLLEGGFPVSSNWERGVPMQASTDLESVRQLTSRQLEVLLLLSEGYSVKQVAQKLHLSVKAVDSMKYRMMKALGFSDRVQLTRFAIRTGLIDP